MLCFCLQNGDSTRSKKRLAATVLLKMQKYRHQLSEQYNLLKKDHSMVNHSKIAAHGKKRGTRFRLQRILPHPCRPV
jgi:hypothetical protein